MRRSRDAAYGIDVMESEKEAIYGFHGDDDCLDAEEGIEASEGGGDDEKAHQSTPVSRHIKRKVPLGGGGK